MAPPRFALSGCTRLFLLSSCVWFPLHTIRAEETVAVPRSEWEEMKREMAQMHRELDQLKAAKASTPAALLAQPAAAAAPAQSRGTTPLAILNQRVDELASAVSLVKPGENKVVLSGEAEANWNTFNGLHESSYFADFAPVLVWHLSDQLLFEGKVRFTSEETGTFTHLEYAQLDWTVGDHLTLVLGKFYSPINTFAERYYAAWANPLPTVPLGVFDVLPEDNIGFQIRGAFPLWNDGAKLLISAFAGNAAAYQRSQDSLSIDFENFERGKHNGAGGGRIGLQFCPNFEVGYGAEYARLQPLSGSGSGSETLPFWVQSLDLQAWLDALKGRWTLRGQYDWSHIANGSFTVPGASQTTTGGDSTGTDSTSTTTDSIESVFTSEEISEIASRRDGGYLQLSYRGTEWQSDFLNRLEVVVRADHSAVSNHRFIFQDHFRSAFFNDDTSLTFITPGTSTNRYSVGVDYWLGDYTVLKLSYNHEHSNGAHDQDFFVVGFATGL
jgi:hypothetical protein